MPPNLQEMYNEARKRVTVNCNEYHAHSALEGCLSGPPDAVAICKLAEYALALERAAAEFHAHMASLQVTRGPW